MKVALRYDLRAPGFGTPISDLYGAALEQCAWGDEAGFDLVVFNEHHGSEDGYCPSPIVLASAAAARTRRVRLQFAALILPLHHPLRVAEDIAVLDVISGGRVELVVAGGYRGTEFAMFGRDIRRRPSLIEEGVEAIKAAWTGEPFEYRGETVRVTPRPLQRPRPALLIGGAAEPAARRAARVADGFFPMDPRLVAAYEDECRKLGREPGRVIIYGGPQFLHVSEDPDRDWVAIAPHALHEARAYGEWMNEAGVPGPFSNVTDTDALRAMGIYQVATPDECVALARRLGSDATLTLQPLMGGLSPELAWSSLELFAAKVLPQLQR